MAELDEAELHALPATMARASRPNLPGPFRNACCGQFKRRPAPEGR